MTPYMADSLDLGYISNSNPTANEQLIYDIAVADHVLEESDFYTCDYSQRYLFEQAEWTVQSFGFSKSTHVENARTLLVNETIEQQFPKDAELIKSYVVQYGKNISPSRMSAFLTQLKTSELFLNTPFTPQSMMTLLALIVTEDAIALNSQVEFTSDSTEILQDIKIALLSAKCRFQLKKINKYASAMLIYDPKNPDTAQMMLSSLQPKADEMLHELVHLAQVSRGNNSENEYINDYSKREAQAYELVAAYTAVQSGFSGLQEFQDLHKANTKQINEYIVEVYATRMAFLRQLQKEPHNLDLKSKIFVNYMVEKLNAMAFEEIPQYVALKNYQKSIEGSYTPSQHEEANQALQLSIIRNYNHDFIAPVFRVMWDAFVQTGPLFQEKNYTEEQMRTAFSARFINQFRNDEERKLATLLVDLYVKALTSEDIMQALNEFDATIINPLKTRIHMDVFKI